MKSPAIKRTVYIDGRKTGVCLEDALWSTLKEIGRFPCGGPHFFERTRSSTNRRVAEDRFSPWRDFSISVTVCDTLTPWVLAREDTKSSPINSDSDEGDRVEFDIDKDRYKPDKIRAARPR